MTELERIQRDLDVGYTVTRYGTTKALHKQMFDDIKYLNDLAKDNEVLGSVSCFSTNQMKESFKDGCIKAGELDDFDINKY